jgi:hypothetical protein
MIEHSGREILAIQGFHPAYFMYSGDKVAEELLRSRLKEVLLPCSDWKKNNDELLASTQVRVKALKEECLSRQLQIDRMLAEMNVLENILRRSHENGESKATLALNGVRGSCPRYSKGTK